MSARITGSRGWNRGKPVFLALLFLATGLAASAKDPPAEPSEARSSFSLTDRLYAVGVGPDEAIWVTGAYGTLARSTDEGRAWSFQDLGTSLSIFDVALSREGFGLVVGQDGLAWFSVDGGDHWSRISTGVQEHLFAAAISSAGHLVVAGDYGVLLHSSDEGKSWVDVGPREPDDPSLRQDVILNDAELLADGHGIVVGEFAMILRTEDHGATWTSCESPAMETLFGVSMEESGTAVAVGVRGGAVISRDFGASWRSLSIPSSAALLGVSVLGERICIVGRDGEVLYSLDRGQSWVSGADAKTGLRWFRDVILTSVEKAVFVGARGWVGTLDLTPRVAEPGA